MDYKTRIDIEIEERSRMRAEELAIEKVESSTAYHAKALSNNLKISYASAMDLLKVDEELRPGVLALLSKDN